MDDLLREALEIKCRVLGGDGVGFCEETFVPLLAHLLEVPGLKVVNNAEDVSNTLLFGAFEEADLFIS